MNHQSLGVADTPIVRVDGTNTGKRRGDAVAQLYVRFPL
jgi:hypothetical protein